MARSWLIDLGGFAKKVKSSSLPSAEQIKDCGAYRECPNCKFHIDNSDVFPEWPGLPLGVKFDPSDIELLEHLAAKCGIANAEPHKFLHEFIPTLESTEGICYTHPENLPGAKKDGSSVHFFHRTINAYTCGQRKRRKIHHHAGATEEHVRWHKTGKTKSVMEDGIHKGFKKIMVLYVRPEKGSKPYKSNWVMHQYHLGQEEEEKEGEYVVSKIFCQKKQLDKNEENPLVEELYNLTSRTSPRTPNPNPRNPPRVVNSADCDDNLDEKVFLSVNKESESFPGQPSALPIDAKDEDAISGPAWLAGESQPVENSDFDSLDDLLCNEIFDSCAQLNDLGMNTTTVNGFAGNTNLLDGNENASFGIPDLDNIQLDTPPDFQLSNLQFGSQDSILEWIGRLL